MADVTPQLGQRVFLFCAQRACPTAEVDAQLAAFEAELEASEMPPEETAKLLKMLRLHATRLRSPN